MDTYYLFEDILSNRGYHTFCKLSLKTIFIHVLKYRFSLPLLYEIAYINDKYDTKALYNKVMHTSKNLKFYLAKYYYSKTKNNKGYKKSLTEFAAMAPEERSKLYNKDSPFCKYISSDDIVIIDIITYNELDYKEPEEYYTHMLLQDKKLLFCSSKFYNIVKYRKCMKYAFVKMCIDITYTSNLKYYYKKLIKLDEVDTNTILLELICKYKYSKNTIAINTIKYNDLMYTYEGKKERTRIRLMLNLISWLSSQPTDYYKRHRHSKAEGKICYFLKDFGVKDSIIEYYYFARYSKSHIFKLIRDIRIKIIERLPYDKKDHIDTKRIIKQL